MFPTRQSMISTTLCRDPQIRHLRNIEVTEHPRMGTVKGLARPVFFDGARDFDKRSPPVLGEHTDEVLTEAGFSSGEIETMRNNEII